jgi:hypothetical protein
MEYHLNVYLGYFVLRESDNGQDFGVGTEAGIAFVRLPDGRPNPVNQVGFF